MPDVLLPDNTTMAFPEGMSAADIDAALQKHFAVSSATTAPTSPSSAGEAGPGFLRYVGGQLLAGIASGGHAMLAADPTSAGIDPSTPEGQAQLRAPTAEEENQLLYGSPTAKAPDLPANLLGAVARSAGENPVLTGLAPGASALGAMAGKGAQLALPDNKWAPVIAGLGGGLAAAGISSLLARSGVATIAKSLGSSTSMQEAGQKIQTGVKSWLDNELPRLESEAWGPLDAKMHPPPISGESIPASAAVPAALPTAATAELPMLGGAAASGQITLGKPVVPSAGAKPPVIAVTPPAGSPATFVATVGEAPTAAQIEAAMPVRSVPQGPMAAEGPPTALSNYISALTDLSEQGGKLAGQAKERSSTIAGQMLEDLQTRGLTASGAPSAAAGGKALRDSASWDEVRALRSRIGEALANPGQSSVFKDLSDKNLSRLYAAVTEDLRNTAATYGAESEFAAANATSKQLRGLAEDYLKPIANATAPEDAAKAAMSRSTSGGSRLGVLRSLVPSAADELASAHLLQTPAGWARLAPEAKIALVPDAGKRLAIDHAIAAGAASAPVEPLKFLAKELMGGETGAALGVLGHSLLPGVSELMGGAAGTLAGLALPVVASGLYSAARGAIRNPLALAPGLAGAAAGVMGTAPPAPAPNALGGTVPAGSGIP